MCENHKEFLLRCVFMCMCVRGRSHCNINVPMWAHETEGGQPDGWQGETEAEGRFVKHNIGRRDREREWEEEIEKRIEVEGGGGWKDTRGERGQSIKQEIVIFYFF